jgi:DNA-binding CsgD family transcriptional regulator
VTVLWGREPELAALQRLVAGLPDGGGVFAVRGEAGIGKSTLLAAARDDAETGGTRVLSLVGTQAEDRVPYATAHLLLRLTGAEPPTAAGAGRHHRFQVALALLDAVTSLAAQRPLLILVDDAQWLDPSSWEAFAFVGRRLSADPVALLLGMRDGAETDTRLAGLRATELRVRPLSPQASAALLAERSPDLPNDLRDRILAEAAGNPLALGELALTATRIGEHGLLPASLPLTGRLERMFGVSVADLPPASRNLLLAAALNDGDRLDEILAGGSMLAGASLTVRDLEPAVAARLVTVDDNFRVTFRHPLIRSAIQQGAGAARSRRGHAALAQVVADPDRALRHRAAATAGPDEQITGEMAELAYRLQGRGSAAAAVPIWERAAQLTGKPERRASLLLRMLEATLEVADRGRAERIMREIEPADLPIEDRTVLLWLKEVEVGNWSGADRLPGHVAAADRLHRAGRDERALYVLHRTAVRCYFANIGQAMRDDFLAVLDSLDLPPLTPRLVAAYGLIAPVDRGAIVLERLAELEGRPDLTGIDLTELAAGATAVGALSTAMRLAADAVELNRRQGNLTSLNWALAYQAWAGSQLGDASLARASAAQTDTLVPETHQMNLLVPNWCNWAHAESLRGDPGAGELTDRCERALISNGAHAMLVLIRVARGVAALAGRRYADAHDEFDAIFDPAAVGYHPYVRFTVLAHLADAGVNSDRHERVARRIRELEPIAAAGPSPQLRVAMTCARALLDPDDEALRAALGTDLTEWPFERARLQLAYGTRLRRQRPAAARSELRAAADTFTALGARPWAERADSELRAAGESRRRAKDDGIDQLTPQELQVARLVAEGLSNRDIAARLFLSPRTISTHLYRIYPKLGVASRTELATLMTRTYLI